jgi:hydrogenase maturation protease
MNAESILIAGIGNIFFGDDAFGVEVARRLSQRTLPEGVRVIDFGIRGLDLTYALLDPYDAVILVDALPRGNAPGTLYVLEPEIGDVDDSSVADSMVDPHSLDPLKVLRIARSMGGTIERILLVGCEPVPINHDDDFGIEMSTPVLGAIEEAVCMIETLVHRLRSNASFPDQQPARPASNERTAQV